MQIAFGSFKGQQTGDFKEYVLYHKENFVGVTGKAYFGDVFQGKMKCSNYINIFNDSVNYKEEYSAMPCHSSLT